MRPSTAVLLLACVVLAGCSQLASPVNEPTTPTIEPKEPTAPPPQTSETRTQRATATRAQTETRAQTATATRTTIQTVTETLPATQTTTATVTPTRTPTRPPTATATPTRTATATPIASPTPASATLSIATIDAPDETIVLRNTGERPLDLAGYVVDFDDGQRYTFPRYVLEPGATVTLYTGRGDSAGSELYAGFFYPVLNADGDTLLVETPGGRIVLARRVPATPRPLTAT